MTEPCRFSLPWELEEIANLFCDEVLTAVKRSIDVLKPERQRLVLPKPRARLQLIVQVWSACASGATQPSNDLARGDPVPHFDSDGACLHVHHDAVLGVAMVDDHAISRVGVNRVMEWPVIIVVRGLSRVRVFGYVIASVDHGSSRRCPDLAAPARIRLIRVGVAELPIFLIQAVLVYGKGIRKLMVAAGGDPVLPDNSMTTKGNDERCLLLVVWNRDPEHLFRPMALRIGDH